MNVGAIAQETRPTSQKARAQPPSTISLNLTDAYKVSSDKSNLGFFNE
jgi:hypothetical protein